ncbi:NAD(P)H-nitrate reductase [Basidiobolus meristosporus CBS 931.73]|uniref:Nitrate reductase [NADPH] n=1 Tax=Basidiobolus meristosporus CBS 931.73 TaxID=1314790 RepID=A0A1Y1YUJ7_9FUNG|nr:NAD(P)H-nitrate reductase [Basidiobolus meristosporus CBS 931.73]|eukprot:ORY01636.1 NAD(P)H-nitrate reductase [Basidiobolus meristosporus CBS 931.73]
MIYKSFPKFAADEEIVFDKRDEQTPDNWIKRHPKLIRLTGKHPFNGEPDPTILFDEGYITSNATFYVRNHGLVPKLDWETHTLEVTGLVDNPKTFTMDELAGFPKRQFPVTFPCAGNRRREVNLVKQSKGFSWGSAGVSTSIFGGLMLRDLLLACGVQVPTEEEDDWHVHFEGAEMLPNGLYATSISYKYAMNEDNEVLMAYEMNGVPLSPDHGFPIRLLVPGIIGGRMVKWVKKIFVSKVESDNWYHIYDNRIIPSHVEFEESVRDNWWQNPSYIINPMNINSAFAYPRNNEVVPISQPTYKCRGYAYTGNGSKVTRVELSLDDGKSWILANIDRHDPSPISKKYWAWALWSYDLPLNKLLRCEEIIVRAWDSTLNTQPVNITWNIIGQMNNCYFRLKVNLEENDEGEMVFRFQHPCVSEKEGWMVDKYGGQKTEEKPVEKPKGDKSFTQEEISKHNQPDDCWMVINKRVYDVTDFIKEHPGGAESLTLNAAMDCTEDFVAVHSTNAHEILEKYYVGELEGEMKKNTQNVPQNEIDSAVALAPREYRTFPLIEKIQITHNTILLRFQLPSSKHRMGLPVGKHVYLKAKINGENVVRAYTPNSLDEELGHVDLVIKVYRKNTDPMFPEGGVMSQYLDSLKIGDTVEMKGPIGHFVYEGCGNYNLNNGQTKGTVDHIGMIAGGSGITPVLQVIKSVLRNPNDKTKLSLVFANRSPDDILLRDELDRLTQEHPEQFKVWYTVDKCTEADWKYSVGFVNLEMCKTHLPQPSTEESKSLILLCGPAPMLECGCAPVLEKLNFKPESIVNF